MNRSWCFQELAVRIIVVLGAFRALTRCHVILRRSWAGIGRADFKPEISTAALLSVCYRSEPPRRHPASSEGFDRNSTVT